MSDENDGTPAVETQDAGKQIEPQPVTLPDEPANELETLKAEKAEAARLAQTLKDEKAALEQRLKDNQAYISRTRKVEPEPAAPKPVKTMDEYLGDLDKIVDDDFEADPKQGLKKALRKIVGDVAWDRDIERNEIEKRVKDAEERAFKKALILNPESSKALREIEKLDEECPDMQGLPMERKMEFIALRNGVASKQTADIRRNVSRETDLARGVGGGAGGGKERVPQWVNDPKVAEGALEAGIKTKQELLNWADPVKAREQYQRKLAAQRQG